MTSYFYIVFFFAKPCTIFSFFFNFLLNVWLRTFAIATMQLSIATPINYLQRKWNRGNSDHLLQPFYNWLRYHLLFATISVLRATKHFAWQKSDLLQLKVQLVAITPPIATKSCRCDKKAWHKGQKLVVKHIRLNRILVHRMTSSKATQKPASAARYPALSRPTYV